jgi:hypothetical protein
MLDTIQPPCCPRCQAARNLVRVDDLLEARCDACATTESVYITCVPRGTWTLVEPDGVVQSFPTQAELLRKMAGTGPITQPGLDSEPELSLRDVTVVPVPKVPTTKPSGPTKSAPPLPKARSASSTPPVPKTPPPPPPSIRVPSEPTASSPDVAPVATHAASSKRWPLIAGLVVVAGVTLIVARYRETGDHATTEPAIPHPAESAHSIASVPEAVVEGPALALTVDRPATVESVPSAAPATNDDEKPTTTVDLTTTVRQNGDPHAGIVADGLSLSDLLVQASAARKAGNVARAKTLFDRALVASPGNVEAYTGLGDLARMAGDLPGAKQAYERALATSPSYSSARLGLADTEWDLGDTASAQRDYRTVVDTSLSPPERARQRATMARADVPVAVPRPTVRTLTSADFPPSPTAPAE